MLRVKLIPANDLTEEHISLWHGFQNQNPAIASPYFSPYFTMAVAGVRDNAFVAILSDGSNVIGFFPFELKAKGIGKPIGGPMSDLHGVIAAPATDWNAVELLRGCGLKIFDFDHLLASQDPFRPFHTSVQESPFLDLSHGFDRYFEDRRLAGSKVIQETARKSRKIEREVGPIHFEPHTQKGEVLASLLQWKSEQYHRTGGVDIFSYRWTARLLEEIHRTQRDDFAGVLSALYVGDKLAAAHLGMRSRTIWHWWFPAYSDEFSSFSPGAILLLEMAKASSSLGLTIIDLGKGDAEYKRRFSSGGTLIAEGFVSNLSLEGCMRRALHCTERLSTSLPLGRMSYWPGKALNRVKRLRRFD